MLAAARPLASGEPEACGYERRVYHTAAPQMLGVVGAALAAGLVAWMLDAFDVMLFALVLPNISADLGLSKAQGGLLGSVMLIAAAAGGVTYSFDVVLNTVMLHHLPRKTREQAMREMRRVLKPGGRLLAVDFGGSSADGRGPLAHFHRHGHFRPRDLV